MCGRLACSLCPNEIQTCCEYTDKNGKLSKPKWIDDTGCTYKPFYNGPPTTNVPVLVHKTFFEGGNDAEWPDYCIAPMRWGFIPSYQFDKNSLQYTHNARIETVTRSHMYKPTLLSGGRCVILSEGFYEWQTTQGDKNKQPYFIYQDPYDFSDESCGQGKRKYLMKMAGLCTCTKSKSDGEISYSCTVFTTESDASLSWLHHRMPVLLNTESELDDWLNAKTVSYPTILKQISETFISRVDKKFQLKYHTVDKKLVNNTSCNDEKCMARMSVKRPNTLDGWLKSSKPTK